MRCVPGSRWRSSSESERFASARPGLRPPSVPMTRTVVGSERSGSVALRELRLRVLREPRVRLVHAARERPVPEGAPENGQNEKSHDGENGPQPPAAPPLRRSRRACGLRRGARGAREWDLALLAAAAIQPIGLVSHGHAGRYGSPRRGGSRRHRARRGGHEDPVRPRRSRGQRAGGARGAQPGRIRGGRARGARRRRRGAARRPRRRDRLRHPGEPRAWNAGAS